MSLALAVLLAAVLLAPARSSAQASPELELAQRYAPVVRLVEQKEPCGHGEPYVPTNVNLVLGNAEVALRGPWDTTNVVKVAPTAADLSRGLFGYHLDLPGNALKPGCTYDEWSHELNAGSSPVTYARVVGEAAYPGQLALQYWFFYVYNDFNDKHEGDWEMIQLDFDAPTAAAALQAKPALVGYSQHEGAESARWGDAKLTIVDGTHPVVYPALGSHANYFGPALYLGRSAAQGVGCDNTNGPSTELRPVVELVPTDPAAAVRAFPWLGFDGHWGEEHQGFYNGPTGPNTKLQWTEPISWSEDSWRDTSFTVPAGGAVGSNATDFFCGAVAAGSNLLTSIVGNPSPLLLALAALLVALIWLSSRTDWRPSAPLRLRRRRAWGAMITSGWRMYVSHLGLFVRIGLLFVPVGLLITLVQYVVFRVGGLAPLAESAGDSNALVAMLAFSLGALFTLVGLAFVQTATAIAMVELDEERPIGALAAYRLALPRLGAVAGSLVLAGLVVAVCDLTTIGIVIAVWLIVRWSLLAQVIALEKKSAFRALRRSGELIRGDWWRACTLTVVVAGLGLLLGPLIGSLLLFATSASFDFVNLVSSLVYVVVLPFVAITTTYLYYDLLVGERSEAARRADRRQILPAE